MDDATSVVFVVDDDPSIRAAIESLLASVGLVTRSFASAQEFLEAASITGPACLILDVRMPGTSGLDLQHELAARELRLPIVFITGHGDIPMSVRAMKAGAVEFLPKPFRDQDLIDAVREGLEQARSTQQARTELADLRRRFAMLTPREQQVMGLVVSGLLNKQVAFELGISEVTVKIHRGQAMQKMHANSIADLVRMAEAIRLGKATFKPLGWQL